MNRYLLINGLASEEMVALDAYIREQLCTRPASGPDAQSIDEAAKETLDAFVMKAMLECGGLVTAKVQASVILLADKTYPDPLERMRMAAKALRGEQ